MLGLTVHLSPTGKDALLSIALAQSGLSQRDDLVWEAEIPPGEPIITKYVDVIGEMAFFFPFPISPVIHEWKGLPIDLMCRLYKCMGAFAVIEVREENRLLFQQVMLECEEDLSVMT